MYRHTHSLTLTQTNGYITETLRWRSGGHGAPGRSDREKDVRLAGKATNSLRNQLKVTRANGVFFTPRPTAQTWARSAQTQRVLLTFGEAQNHAPRRVDHPLTLEKLALLSLLNACVF